MGESERPRVGRSERRYLWSLALMLFVGAALACGEGRWRSAGTRLIFGQAFFLTLHTTFWLRDLPGERGLRLRVTEEPGE